MISTVIPAQALSIINAVIPAQVGIHDLQFFHSKLPVDSRFHGNDGKEAIGQQAVAQLFQLPWGHNLQIISKLSGIQDLENELREDNNKEVHS
jgi:hypothetical protein